MLNYFTEGCRQRLWRQAEKSVAILSAFGTPYPAANNLYPVVLSLAELLL
jgi:hypothetical protein